MALFFVINWPGLRYKFEIWRLVTPFLYVGPFSIDTLFTLYMLVQYSQRYELGAYNTGAGGGSADAAFLLMFAGTIIHALCYLWLGPMLLVRTMIFVLLYCWTKREPNTQVSIFGFPIQARYLPFAILALDTLMGKDYIPDLVGIGVGHICKILNSNIVFHVSVCSPCHFHMFHSLFHSRDCSSALWKRFFAHT